MHAYASRLVMTALLIGWKSGANFLSQSCSVERTKPITFRHSNENRSIIVVIYYSYCLHCLEVHVVALLADPSCIVSAPHPNPQLKNFQTTNLLISWQTLNSENCRKDQLISLNIKITDHGKCN